MFFRNWWTVAKRVEEKGSHFVYSLCDFTWVFVWEISRTIYKLYRYIHFIYIKILQTSSSQEV